MDEDFIYIPIIHIVVLIFGREQQMDKTLVGRTPKLVYSMAGLQSAYGHGLENPSSASWAKQIFKIHFTNCVHWSTWFQFVGTDFETHTHL